MYELIIEFLIGKHNTSNAIAPLALMAIGQGVSSLISGFSARRQAKLAKREAIAAENRLRDLEANRQEIINPYAGVTDLSSMITNPFENLQVATMASEMQARETDISLASTLDALRASGGGSATALAQAASRAKQGVAASIEQQEAQNARLRAQGEQQMQQIRMSEAARVQGVRASGEAFVFGQREAREMQQIERAQAQSEQYRALEAGQRGAASSAFGSALGTAFSFGAQAIGGTNPFSGNPMSGSYNEYQSQGGTMSRQDFRDIKGYIN